MNKITFTGMTADEIAEHLPKGKEKYRSSQIFQWINERCVTSFDSMTNLSKAFRDELSENFSVGAIELVEHLISSDKSTDKFLWKLQDDNLVESVIIRDEDRLTVCISSQIGCKMGCSFCRTAGMGFIRNLTAAEIVDQIIKMRTILRENGEDIINIVFMGMGEPLDNIDAVLKAIKIINTEAGISIGQRKITVSTCGLVHGMPILAQAFKRIGLAISLNAVDNKLRTRLMPINKRYPLETVIEEARNFAKVTKRRVTFEYILLEEINDTLEDAKKLLSIARKVPSKINLIAYNEYQGCTYGSPSDKKIEAFQKLLFDGGVTAFLRKSKGTDIMAACGQLAVKGKEKKKIKNK